MYLRRVCVRSPADAGNLRYSTWDATQPKITSGML